MARNGENVGKTILFFGCRKQSEDFLYEKEWEVSRNNQAHHQKFSNSTNHSTQEYKSALGDSLEVVTAFSRETSKKVYVQHRLRERAAEVNELLLQKAYFYVCGDAANMAREVNEILGQIIAEHRGVDKKKGEEIVKSMRSANQYQEDVWS